MNDINDSHAKSQEAHPSTVELLSSLFEESKESKIRRVKEKTRLKSAARKSGAAGRPMKDVQKRTSMNRQARQTWLSSSKVEAKEIKKKTQVRKPVVSRKIKVKDPEIKARAQEKPDKIIVEKRSVPASRKKINKISESRVVKRERPAVSEVCVPPPVASSDSQRRSLFGSTTLNIVLPFAMGVLLTFLGTRLLPLYIFDGDQGIALAKNEMVENPAPEKQDVTIPTALETAVDTAKQGIALVKIKMVENLIPKMPILRVRLPGNSIEFHVDGIDSTFH